MNREECEFLKLDPQLFQTGVILGCVDVVDVIETDKRGAEVRYFEVIGKYGLHPFGQDFLVGPYAWLVNNPRKLKHSIPAKGKLNLWNFNIDNSASLKFEEASPLLGYSEPSKVEKFRVVLDVNGQDEPVVYVRNGNLIEMYFMKQYRKHIPMEKTSSQYINKDACYKAGCEKAWELFPDKFNQ